MLCPGCRKLISSNVSCCPYCGLSGPGSRWINTWLRAGIHDVDRFFTMLIWVNVVMYVLTILIDPQGTNFSLNPMSFLAPGNNNLFLLGATGLFPIHGFNRWWTLVSASYLHGSILHIVFNMIALKQLGPMVAREYGLYRMFIIYTLAGVAGFLLSYIGGVRFTIGASAAICGLIGAALFYGKHRGGTYGQAVFQQVGGWVISLFLFGFMVPGINNWAHGGGLAAGILFGFLLGYRERKPENFLDKSLAISCVVVTLLVLGWAITSGFYYRFLMHA